MWSADMSKAVRIVIFPESMVSIISFVRLRILGLTTLETRFLQADLGLQDIERVKEFRSG